MNLYQEYLKMQQKSETALTRADFIREKFKGIESSKKINYTEIAKEFNISRQRVQQILTGYKSKTPYTDARKAYLKGYRLSHPEQFREYARTKRLNPVYRTWQKKYSIGYRQRNRKRYLIWELTSALNRIVKIDDNPTWKEWLSYIEVVKSKL